jgi:hypothetical protein
MSTLTDYKAIKALKTNNRNLPEVVSKIELGRETKQILDKLQARIRFELGPDLMGPMMTVVSAETGKRVATMEEFTAIGTYRRFLIEAKKEAENVRIQDRKTKLVVLAKQVGKEWGLTVPDLVIPSNWTHFNATYGLLEVVKTNVEGLKQLEDDTGDLEFLVSLGNLIVGCIAQELVICMTDTKVQKGFREETLFKARVPSWFAKRMMTPKLFTGVMTCVSDLLYPRNFLKGLAFTTKEVMDLDFMFTVRTLTAKDTDYLQYVRNFLNSGLFHKLETQEGIKRFEERLERFMWNVQSKKDVQELLDERMAGKGFTTPTTYTDRGTGPEMRLVTQNMMMCQNFNYYWQAAMRFIVNAVDPINQFWTAGFNVSTWEISAEKTIYHWINEDIAHVEVLNELQANQGAWKGALSEFIVHSMGYFEDKVKNTMLSVIDFNFPSNEEEEEESVAPMEGEQKEEETTTPKPENQDMSSGKKTKELLPGQVEFIKPPPKIADGGRIVERLNQYLDTERTSLTEDDRKAYVKFARIKVKKTAGPKERGMANRGELNSKCLKLLKKIQELYGDEFMERVKIYVQTTYVTSADLREQVLELILNAIDTGLEMEPEDEEEEGI